MEQIRLLLGSVLAMTGGDPDLGFLGFEAVSLRRTGWRGLHYLGLAWILSAIITLTKVPPPIDRPGQAGEIEITPQMIEAGFSVLRASGLADEYSEADKILVAQIFEAMALGHHAFLARVSTK